MQLAQIPEGTAVRVDCVAGCVGHAESAFFALLGTVAIVLLLILTLVLLEIRDRLIKSLIIGVTLSFAIHAAPKPFTPQQRIEILTQQVIGYRAAVVMKEQEIAQMQLRGLLADEKLPPEKKQDYEQRLKQAEANHAQAGKVVDAANAKIDELFKQAQKDNRCEKCSVTEDFHWQIPK